MFHDIQVNILSLEQLKSSQIHEMKLETLEHVTIAVEPFSVVKEFIVTMCLQHPIRTMEPCFSEITRETAVSLFRIPELVTKSKR